MTEETLSEILKTRVTPSDKKRIEAKAKKSNMRISDYLRRCLMRGVTFKIEENSERPQ